MNRIQLQLRLIRRELWKNSIILLNLLILRKHFSVYLFAVVNFQISLFNYTRRETFYLRAKMLDNHGDLHDISGRS